MLKTRKVTSPFSHYSRAHSPGMATPSLSGAARFNTSYHSSLVTSPKSTCNDTVVTVMEPILPELCMEQLWSETVTAGSHR